MTIGWGDVDAAFDDAHLIVEGRTRYPMLYAYAMEPYNAVASFGDDSLTWSARRSIRSWFATDLARIFGLPLARVRVTPPIWAVVTARSPTQRWSRWRRWRHGPSAGR